MTMIVVDIHNARLGSVFEVDSFEEGKSAIKKLAEHKLSRELNNEENESLEDCVLGGAGKPSLETFFHLLPSKIIVHLHPTFFLGPLCSKDVSSIFTNEDFPSSLLIKYNKPGLLLAKDIFKAYNEEDYMKLINFKGEITDLISDSFPDSEH